MTPTIRVLTPADGDALVDLDDYAFVVDPDRAARATALEPVDFSQAFGAHTDDGRLVGAYLWFDLRLGSSGPLGTYTARPLAGLSWVAVHPDHRRRGVLRTLIRHHLDTLRDRGTAWSGLHASEADIYGRFGYAVASLGIGYTLKKGVTLAAPEPIATGADAVAVETLLRVDDDGLAARFAAIDDACSAARPGTVTLPRANARTRLRDYPQDRRGSEPVRGLVATRDGRDVGYALYVRTPARSGARPEGSVEVRHLQAADADAMLALGRRLVDMDLMSSVTFPHRSLDDPLLWWAGGPRGAEVEAHDGLWLRPVDVGAALSERGYAASCDVILDVADETCPWNARAWRLRVSSDGHGTCVPVETDDATVTRGGTDDGGGGAEREADLPVVALPVQAFGAIHLGLRSFAALAATGDARVSAGDAAATLHGLDAAFAVSPAPVGGLPF